MTYDYKEKKTMIVIASSVEAGIAANIIGHLALAVGHSLDPGDMGRRVIQDNSGIEHNGISRYAIIVTTVKMQRLRKLIHQARAEKEIFLIDYPEQMLLTAHDDELACALTSSKEEDLNYLGAAIHGDSRTINKLAGNFSLWKPQSHK